MIKNINLFIPPKITNTISLVLVILAIAYIAMKSIFLDADTVDFQFIWLAGHMWLNDLNPYSEEFKNLGHQLFVGTNQPEFWFYPPNWWIVSELSALVPYNISGKLWRVFSALLILLGSALVIKNYYPNKSAIQPLRASIFIFYVCVMFGTAIALSLGQTSAIIYFGVACFISSYLNGNKALMVVAITIVMLKPHIGIIICAFLLTSPKWIPSIVWAAAISILISIPALRLAGLESFISQFLGQLHSHGLHPFNTPAATTGLRNLLSAFIGWETSVVSLTVVGFFSSFLLGLSSHHLQPKAGLEKDNKALSLCILLSLIVFFIPLHNYDLMIIAPIIILISRLHQRLQIAIAVMLLMFFRTNNLTELTGLFSDKEFSGNYLISITSLILLVTLVLVQSAEKRLKL